MHAAHLCRRGGLSTNASSSHARLRPCMHAVTLLPERWVSVHDPAAGHATQQQQPDLRICTDWPRRTSGCRVSPALAVCLSPQIMSLVGCSVFRPILKESYFQDPSDGSSRLCFELRKNEAQNLCRAFDKAGNVQVASTLTRIADPAALGGLAWWGIPKAYFLG